MAEGTKIEWCDHSASPWHGCSKTENPGCDNCYAAAMSVRNPGTLGVWGDDGTRVKSRSFINNIRKWNRQGEKERRVHTVFPSICDPFEDRPELEPWRREMFEAIDTLPWVRLLLLTKRPENVLRMWSPPDWNACLTGDCPHELQSECDESMRDPEANARDNIAIGTSVSDQQTANDYWGRLVDAGPLTPCLFLSMEPLIGPIDCHEMWRNGPLPAWTIIGGESGPNARPCEVEWFSDIAAQCLGAGVPVFVKQDMGPRPGMRGRLPDHLWSLKQLPGV